MGAPETEPGTQTDERPIHAVTIGYALEMMETEVTQAMWQEIMGYNNSVFQNPDNPVEFASWFECGEFVDRVNALDESYQYRLPSESEWEYCCRAGTATTFFWGNDPDTTQIEQYAWWNGNSGLTTHPVASKLPNQWGLFDMTGNVWEWCQDTDHDSYVGAPNDGSAWVTEGDTIRMERGGCYWDYPAGCRSADRSRAPADNRMSSRGFRLVRTPQ